jgi:hypothetical protein
LGTYDVLLADRLVITTDAIDALEGVSEPVAAADTPEGGDAT